MIPPAEAAADLKRFGIPCAGLPVLEALPSDAGARRYVRIRTGPGRTAMLMLLPPGGGDRELGAAEASAELPYLNVQRFLKGRGLPVPEVYGHDAQKGRLYQEDLGSRHLSAEADAASAYVKAASLLSELHRRTSQPDPACLAFRRRFDGAAIRAELKEFQEFGLPAPDTAVVLNAELDALASRMASLPAVFSHRDFHGDNLLVRPDGSLVMIDFQDAFLAPASYDLASLLTDRGAADRVGWDTVERLARDSGDEAGFWICALQRQCKVAGRFVNLERKGKTGYARHLPATWKVIRRALERTGASRLKELLASVGAGV